MRSFEVISHDNKTVFENLVSNAIDKGYVPVGSVIKNNKYWQLGVVKLPGDDKSQANSSK